METKTHSGPNQNGGKGGGGAERQRLAEDALRKKNWKRWGPYLAERQWATVREDYSPDGDCWNYFPHDHARSRAYRWGEDGLLGICDRECRLCFSVALWNGNDAILKERLFGLTGPEGNHGEDVKEYYFYVDSTPTHSYMKAIYKYPQGEFPYTRLVEENRHRTRMDPEFEVGDTGAFDDGRYFDVQAEYAKKDADDILILLTVTNRGREDATLHLMPTVWFRNSWAWGCTHEGCEPKGSMVRDGTLGVRVKHSTLGTYLFSAESVPAVVPPKLIFTENETNVQRLFHAPNPQPYVKDAFHRYVIDRQEEAVNPSEVGSKAAVHYEFELAPGQSVTVRLRLSAVVEGSAAPAEPFGPDFGPTFAARKQEADAFYDALLPGNLSAEEKLVARQANAGLLWSKQFYHYVVESWLKGDPNMPPPPGSRWGGRNCDWPNLFSRDVLSMPDKWEYPWFASWDLAFHMIPMAKVDGEYAKEQLLLLLREWYTHPSGQLPAYEFAFGDANPPVHAWSVWRVYKMTGKKGQRDVMFLARAFQKLLMNFTWWVNRKDISGKHVFSGGFLGLDNIGLFDRSKPLPNGSALNQADGTAWMAFYCGTMLSIALELAMHDASYEDVASKFFEHFVDIVDAINTLGGTGLWDDADGFYYDHLKTSDMNAPLRVRSIVGLVPIMAVEILERDVVTRLPGFAKRMNWFIKHRQDLAKHITFCDASTSQVAEAGKASGPGHYLLAIPSQEKLERVLRYAFDESEFLSPHGIRSVSRFHLEHPVIFQMDGQRLELHYEPAESRTGIFGGNSNWRGPVWFPMNFLFIESLERYAHFYEDKFTFEFPTGSGVKLTLTKIAQELRRRLMTLFLPNADGVRPAMVQDKILQDPWSRELLLFHEYFHGDTGAGLGASHQTGWTALVASLMMGLDAEDADEYHKMHTMTVAKK